MAWWLLPLATTGLGIFSAFQQSEAAANQAESQLSLQRQQIEWQNHLGKMKLHEDNRKKAVADGARLVGNMNITGAALQKEQEDLLYQRIKIDNELNMFSTSNKKIDDAIMSTLSEKGIERGTGTAQAIVSTQRNRVYNEMKNLRLADDSAKKDIKRAKEGALARRDFNYGGYSKFMSTPTDHIDPKGSADAIRNNVLVSGLIQTGIQAATAWNQASLSNEQSQFFDLQMENFGQQSDLLSSIEEALARLQGGSGQ